jgi:microcystin degradation protein MlrC
MQRFVTAVFSQETNTFSSVPTPLEAFGRFSGRNGPVSGEAALSVYRGTNNSVAAFIDLAEEVGAELDFAIASQAVPAGPAEDTIVDITAEAICKAVKAGCDGLFLDLHGGMVTKGYDDPEGELLRRIREVAPELPIAVALDFHTNMSKLTIDNATVITGYCTYPHVDNYETGDRAGRTLLKAMRGEVDPVILWHSLPLLTHMNCQTPSRQPMKDIMDMAMAAEEEGRVLNASVFGGWPLSDIPHVGVHGVIVADREQIDAAQTLLTDLMTMTWDRRDDFFFAVEPIEDSLSRAKGMSDGPIILADHGDVAGSGGSTDVHAVLAEIIKQGLEDICAGPFWDPDTVAQMADAGVGNEVTVQLGGRSDFPAIGLKGEPLELTGTVRCITDGNFIVTGKKNTGMKENIGMTAVLDTGTIEIVICSTRHEPYDVGVFTHAGIDPARKKYILIKSRQHFRAGFEPILKDVVMVSGPGICTSDYSLFPWKNVRRPIYPFDPDVDPGLN